MRALGALVFQENEFSRRDWGARSSWCFAGTGARCSCAAVSLVTGPGLAEDAALKDTAAMQLGVSCFARALECGGHRKEGLNVDASACVPGSDGAARSLTALELRG